MKAITIAPDWLILFMQGEKTIEFRTWKTNYRGEILLCSSAKRIPGCISGHALLVADLTDIVPFKKSHMDPAAMDFMPDSKGFAWILENIRYIKPFPVKGRLGLFDVDVRPEIFPPDATDEEGGIFADKYIIPLIYKPAQT